MSDRASPLGAAFNPGRFGDLSSEPGVMLGEMNFGYAAEIAAFDHALAGTTRIISDALKSANGGFSFQFARNRWLVAGPVALRDAMARTVDASSLSLMDQTHGRTALTVSGPRVEWVLTKLFAIDFREKAFPPCTGLATLHHDIPAWIYREAGDGFILFVPRSYARSFWHTLHRAAEEVGYEVK
jgi:methylglutamate dehydrogenase subunit D